MTIKEVAELLACSRAHAETLITMGMELPSSKETVKLSATLIDGAQHVSDEELNAFIARFEAEAPGRHPPVGVRRDLLVESGHACAICREKAPSNFHHMLEWSKIKQHNPAHMLHLCGTCHDRCGNGQIDRKSQQSYKTKLKERNNGPVDPYVATKRTADKRILEQMFHCAPRPLVVTFLEQASFEYIYIRLLGYIRAVYEEVRSPAFHLYDKDLWRLVKEFLTEWNTAIQISLPIYFDESRNLVASPIMPPQGEDRELYFENREEFTRRIFLTQHAYEMLICYIREEYPEFDLDKIDSAGLRSIKEGEAESRRQVERGPQATEKRAKREIKDGSGD